MSKATGIPRTPAVPRPSATILLVRDDPFEVLMVRRSAGGPFPDALVFPGGTVDAHDHDDAWRPLLRGADALTPDERALRIAAIRETFEEVGLFLGVDGESRAVAPAACDTADFRSLVEASGALLPLDALVPFAHWITPEQNPQRWDTHFYLCRAPADQIAVCDGIETLAPTWRALESVRAIAAEDDMGLLPPTRLNLARLARSVTSAGALAAARARPAFTVAARHEKRPEGSYVLIPIEAGYGVSEVRLAPLSPPVA